MSDVGDAGSVGAAPVGDVGGSDALPEGVQSFDRAYVEKLRNESAGYRTQLREAQQAASRYEVFDAYDDEDRGVWLDLASTWQADPYQAAETMRTIANRVLGEAQQAQQQPGQPNQPGQQQTTTTIWS